MATPKILYKGQPGTGAGNLGSAVPAGKKWVIKQIVLVNTTATAATVTLDLNDSGEAGAQVTNRIVGGVSVAANDVVTLDLSAVLDAAGQINGLQGTAAAITVHVYGYEVSA